MVIRWRSAMCAGRCGESCNSDIPVYAHWLLFDCMAHLQPCMGCIDCGADCWDVVRPSDGAMKRGRSTGTPTKEEAARIVAIKELGLCMACESLRAIDMAGCDFDGVDFHHFKSGNIRRGHMFGVGLCTWHHRRHPIEGTTCRAMALLFGPSLLDGGKNFANVFGADDELLERQNKLLGGGYE